MLVVLEGDDVAIAATQCVHCARGELREDTARACWLARGTVVGEVDGAGRSRVILGGAEIVDHSE